MWSEMGAGLDNHQDFPFMLRDILFLLTLAQTDFQFKTEW